MGLSSSGSESLSARRAWIEIGTAIRPRKDGRVALRKESVDRNFDVDIIKQENSVVALRKESVDRNLDIRDPTTTLPRSLSARRAWIEMKSGLRPLIASAASLSARRAWIEMGKSKTQADPAKSSLSARRAWIEILWPSRLRQNSVVALRKESVDRNTMRRDFKALGLRRSPQGERG